MNENPPPSFKAMLGLGVLLNIGSVLLCLPFQHPAPFFLGALAAFISLFFEGYRGIFVGFILVIGVVLLGVAIICGSMATGIIR